MNNETLILALKGVPAICGHVSLIRLYESRSSHPERIAQSERAILTAIETVAYLNGREVNSSEALQVLTGIVDT